MTDEVIFVVSDISIHVFLLYKDWAFDVCKDERVAVFLDAHPLSSMVVADIYTETKSPNPLEKVGWGIFSSVTAFVPILIYSGFPDFFSKGARNL